jgi:cyclopropane fatty-acyl-phospholipid synthase-like methyltransferase
MSFQMQLFSDKGLYEHPGPGPFVFLGRKHEINPTPGCPSNPYSAATPSVQRASTAITLSGEEPEIASKRIKDAGMDDRLGVSPGDCFVDPFPAGVDCILFAHFFTIWSDSRNRQLLKKCYESLPAGGLVVIFNMMQRDSEDGPYSAAMASPYFLTLATGEGMMYTWREYGQWMRDAGFASVTRHVLPRDHGLIIGRK